MTIKEVKLWLKRAYTIEKRVHELKTLVNQCRERATGLTRGGQYNYTGKSDTRLNRAENACIRLADIEQKYNNQVQELIETEQEIKNAISSLNDFELETVLIHRYLLHNTIDKTAMAMYCSEATVKRRTQQALEKLCDILG